MAKKQKKMIRVRKLNKDIPKISIQVCENMLKDLEKAKRPVLSAVKCSLDNSEYDSQRGYLIPKGKMVQSELNVSSVQKISRAVFLLEILLNNLKGGLVVLYLEGSY